MCINITSEVGENVSSKGVSIFIRFDDLKSFKWGFRDSKRQIKDAKPIFKNEQC